MEFGGVEIDESSLLGTGTDKAHVSLQNREELREFVEFRASEKTPDAREALIAMERERDAGGVVVHLPKFRKAKLAATVPGSAAAEENRTGALELDRNRDDGHHGQQQKEQQK